MYYCKNHTKNPDWFYLAKGYFTFNFFLIVGANNGCTKRGEKCSDSYDCPSSGGEQEKLRVKCRRAKACCKCTC